MTSSTDPGNHNMQLNISGHHVELSPALQHYVKTKLQRIQRHFDHVVDAHVVLGAVRVTVPGRPVIGRGAVLVTVRRRRAVITAVLSVILRERGHRERRERRDEDEEPETRPHHAAFLPRSFSAICPASAGMEVFMSARIDVASFAIFSVASASIVSASVRAFASSSRSRRCAS